MPGQLGRRRRRPSRFLPALRLAAVAAGTACAVTEPFALPAPPPPPPALPIHVLPATATLVPEQVIQFSARVGNDPLPATELAWSIADTSFGTVSPAGLFTATRCFLGGQTEIRAQLLRDAARSGTASVHVVVPAFALVAIQSARTASDQLPADLSRVAGDIDVTVRAAAVACRDIVSLRLEVTGPVGDTALPATEFQPPRTENTSAVMRWATGAANGQGRAFPNGGYAIRAILLDSRGTISRSNGVPLQLLNP